MPSRIWHHWHRYRLPFCLFLCPESIMGYYQGFNHVFVGDSCLLEVRRSEHINRLERNSLRVIDSFANRAVAQTLFVCSLDLLMIIFDEGSDIFSLFGSHSCEVASVHINYLILLVPSWSAEYPNFYWN